MSTNGEHWEKTRSIWQLTQEPLAFPALASDVEAEVCVVGGGIAGLSVAFELGRAGRSVILIDDGSIGAGMTGRTTAHLVNALDDRYSELERLLGAENAHLAAASHTAAIDRIDRIVHEEQIACDFERLSGFLFNPPGESAEVLENEFEAGRRAGLALEKVDRAPMPGIETGMALRFPAQAQFHPLKYLAGLTAAIQRQGGRIFTGTHASNIQGGSPARVTTASGHTIRAASVVVATNTPVNDRYVIHTKQAPYTTYAIGLHLPAGALPHVLLWDTGQEAGMQDQAGPIPYHYVRMQTVGDHDVLIVGGEDHKTGQNDDFAARFEALENWTRPRFPMVGAVEYRWSGQVMEPVDGMGYIGHNPADDQNVYICTGDSGNGMTHGAIAGMLITDLILGRENAWEPLYNPRRRTTKAATDFLHENLNVAAQMKDYLTRGDVKSADDIAPGCGAILREGTTKIAAYRDENGTLHRFSAICPHLKCVVHWNPLERTWDCPCHGSRFDATGAVITGPANRDLDKA